MVVNLKLQQSHNIMELTDMISITKALVLKGKGFWNSHITVLN